MNESAGVAIARSITKSVIAACCAVCSWLLAIGGMVSRSADRAGSRISTWSGVLARTIIPVYRAWWTFRRITAQSPRRGTETVLRILSSRFAVYAMFVIAVLGVASQSLHAKEYGGFVGDQAFLAAFIERDAPEIVEDVVEGVATRAALPAFRVASVHAAMQPIVLGAEVTAMQAPPSSGFAIVQPILTDAAIADAGRAGVERYTVETGDTPSTIAEQFGLATTTILWENTLQAWSVIQPGQTLRVLPTDGVTHTVQRGETLERIAEKYRADAEDILEFNALVDADDLTAGDLLIIPGGRPPQVIAPKPEPKVRRIVPAVPLPSITGKFLWPSIGGYRISQYFSWRHHAIDIAVESGTPVFASDAGTVVSAGWLGGYGYQVLIDHGNGIHTRYAHSSKLLIRKGQTVERGQTIALVGSTGRSTGPHIHYEVFANGNRLNPLQYLR